MILASVVLLIVVTAASGVTLALTGRARSAGVLLSLAALLAGIGAVLRVVDEASTPGLTLILISTYVAVPAAVLTYPDHDWHGPLGFLTSTTAIAAGVVGVVFMDETGVLDAMGLVLGLTIVVHLWWRIETTSGDTRAALQWLAVTAGVVGLLVGLGTFAFDGGAFASGATAVLVLLCAAVGPSMVLGVLRPDVLDVRGVVVGGVVTAVTVVVYLALFGGIVAGIDQLGGEPSPGALALIGAVCALGFHPTQVVLRGVVDQLLFGDRPDPLRAATEVVDQIGDDPVLALQAIREALVLPYASLRSEGRTLATSGHEVVHTRTLPLQLGADTVGEVVVGLRAGDLTLAQSDANVLRIVAPLLAQTLRSQALARDLQASRNTAIAAIEEERRRLRRDLHDGLGPTLSGVAFSADAARNQLTSDPPAADALLAQLRADTSSAIGEVRRLVEGLRPPALDELGLLGAVRQHAETLHADGGSPLKVTFSAPEPWPDLSAAAEVTVYRIVVEALTNVARHAAATHAAVEFDVSGGDLRLAVQDDGRTANGWRPGVGMSSMRERAEQVGGTLTAAPHRAGGRVEAVIPIGTGTD